MIGLTIGSDQAGQRLDHALSQILPELSRSRIQQLLEQGHITLNGKVPHKSGIRLAGGEQINIHMPTLQPSSQQAENLPLTIQYEDDDLLVIEKAAGMVVHPAPGHASGTLVNALLAHCPNLPGVGDEQRPGIVHRLDKDTSGLLAIAKTDYAMTHLSKQFFDHTVKRSYNALVWGEPELSQGTVIINTGRSQTDPLRFTVFPEGDFGKHAITHYKVLEPLYYVSLLECQLETGRTHQIRVHMKHLGHPLFNDEKYGGSEILKGTVFSKYKQFVHNCFKIIPRQALHAKTLGFKHPVTGEDMFFESDLPPDFKMALEKWRSYLVNRKLVMNNGYPK